MGLQTNPVVATDTTKVTDLAAAVNAVFIDLTDQYNKQPALAFTAGAIPANLKDGDLLVVRKGNTISIQVRNSKGFDPLTLPDLTTLTAQVATNTANIATVTAGLASLNSSIRTGSASLTFTSVPANSTVDQTLGVTGVTVTMYVVLQISSVTAGLSFFGFVSAANSVTIRCINSTTSAKTTSGTFHVLCLGL